MTTPAERWLLDTNVWVFGLRRDANFPACASLLGQIGSFAIIIPLQILKELTVNLTEVEIQDFYRLVNSYPERFEVSWATAPAERVKFYQEHGCRPHASLVFQLRGDGIHGFISQKHATFLSARTPGRNSGRGGIRPVLEITDARELYEEHVKQMPPAERLRLVELIAHEMAIYEKPRGERSLLELEGLGAEIWQGVDAQEYVNNLRQEWDNRS